MSRPELNPTRLNIVAQLGGVLNSPPKLAAMKLSGAAKREFPLNANLTKSPAGPAHEVYTGVLFQALDYAGLSDLGRRRAPEHVAIASALWGVVSPLDRIPAYRLSAGMKLPDLGAVNALWRAPLKEVLDPIAGENLIIDARSGPYVSMWKPTGQARENWFPVRVFVEKDGERSVVSHHAKHTRGLLARNLLNGAALPETAAELAVAAAGMPGIDVEITSAEKPGKSAPLHTLDLIITETT